jgi:predicted pyridoxine 5'-phosphate oxidase superfamily flavin-nucleotide-binding protein
MKVSLEFSDTASLMQDPAGFVRVLGEKYLAIPDRPGNRRLDTFTNILQNPYLAIIFLIPGKGETLRVTGESRIVRDQVLRESMAVNGRIPEFAIVSMSSGS